MFEIVNGILLKYSDTTQVEVDIPEEVQAIKNYAFTGYNKILRITLHKNVNLVEPLAFAGCEHLQAIDVVDDNPRLCSRDGVLFTKNMAELIYYPQGKEDSQYTVPCDALAEGSSEYTTEAIGPYAFANNTHLTHIDLGCVREIGPNAFDYCTALRKVIFPRTLTHIYSHAFGGCTALESAHLEDNVSYFGTHIFEGSGLTHARLPINMSFIPSGMFTGCLELQSVIMPKKCTTIQALAFESCEALASITLPDNLRVIGDGAFSYCKSLTDVNFPSTLIQIGAFAFSRCEQLKLLSLSNSILDIKEYAFYGCTYLRKVNIPERLKTLGKYAFIGCCLSMVTLPAGTSLLANLYEIFDRNVDLI